MTIESDYTERLFARVSPTHMATVVWVMVQFAARKRPLAPGQRRRSMARAVRHIIEQYAAISESERLAAIAADID